MGVKSCPVDVICVCDCCGGIRPLRFRIEDEQKQQVRIDIDRIIGVREVRHVGAESQIFRCTATVWGSLWLFDLKYTIRSHTWSFLGRLY